MILAEAVGPYTLALGALALAGVPFVAHFVRRQFRAELGPLSVEVGGIARQVNHVKDPDNEPTLRDLVIDVANRTTVLEVNTAATTQHCIEARKLAGLAATHAATAEQLVDEHIAEHHRGA